METYLSLLRLIHKLTSNSFNFPVLFSYFICFNKSLPASCLSILFLLISITLKYACVSISLFLDISISRLICQDFFREKKSSLLQRFIKAFDLFLTEGRSTHEVRSIDNRMNIDRYPTGHLQRCLPKIESHKNTTFKFRYLVLFCNSLGKIICISF